MVEKSKGRLTSEWTPTLDEAFDNGPKGREGEEYMARVFDFWGWSWRRNESDKMAQIEGRDIEFKSPNWARFYSGDVKNNMDEYGTIYVYKNWLFKVKCDRIFHVNPDTGWITYYGVSNMRDTFDVNKERMVFTASTRLSFMTTRKVKV